jgi:hypothetical protein
VADLGSIKEPGLFTGQDKNKRVTCSFARPVTLCTGALLPGLQDALHERGNRLDRWQA